MESLPSKLTHLRLISCLTSPDWFQNFSMHLEVLDLSLSSKLSNNDVTTVCQSCKSIKVLHLNGCYRLTSSCMQRVFDELKDLRILGVKDTEFDELALCCLAAKQTNLQALAIGHKTKEKRKLLPNNVLLCQLPAFTKLRHLDLSHSLTEEETVRSLTRLLQRLETLDLRETLVSESDLELSMTNSKIAVNADWTDAMKYEFDRT